MAASTLTLRYNHDGSNRDIGKIERTVVLEADNTAEGLGNLVCAFIEAGPGAAQHITPELRHELSTVIADLMFGRRK